MLKIKLISPPPIEPITVQQVKRQLRFDDDDTSPDDDIAALIPSARQWCEQYQNRAYITQTWRRMLDNWPNECVDDRVWTGAYHIKLPRPPLQMVESFTYTDSSGATVTWEPSNYIVDSISEPGQIVATSRWPDVKLQRVNGIAIEYKAGYGDAPEDVPEYIRQAIIILTAYWWENGQCEPPCAVTNLLDLDRVVPV